MQIWIQPNLFTGEPIDPVEKKTDSQAEISEQVQLALAVQISIARLDPLAETMVLIANLCKSVSGVDYKIDTYERRQSRQRKRKQQTERKVATEIKKAKSKRERPRKKDDYMPAESPMRQQIDKSFHKRGATQ